jgi:hypothetical protein
VLYRNKGRGQFVDVTQATGLAQRSGNWLGCAAGDYNGDGFPDLLLNGHHALALFKNKAGARFVDVTSSVGLNPYNQNQYGTSAGFMDLDGDSRLDLVLQHYVGFGPKTKQSCVVNRILTSCPPTIYKAEYAQVWRNINGTRFENVSRKAGIKETQGKGLVLAFADVDGDGRIDIYLATMHVPPICCATWVT